MSVASADTGLDSPFSCASVPLPIYPDHEIQHALAGLLLPPLLHDTLLGQTDDESEMLPTDLFSLLLYVGTSAHDLTPQQWAALSHLQAYREDIEFEALAGHTMPGQFSLLASARDFGVLDVLTDWQLLCLLAAYRLRDWGLDAARDLQMIPDGYRELKDGWWCTLKDKHVARAAHGRLQKLAFVWFHDWSVNVWPVAAVALAFSGKALPDMDSGLPLFAYPASREKTGGRQPKISEVFYKSCHAQFMAGETDCKSLVDYLLQQGQKSNRSLTRHAVRWAIKTYSD